MPEYLDEFASPESNSAELADVTRVVNYYNYGYVPKESDEPYQETPRVGGAYLFRDAAR